MPGWDSTGLQGERGAGMLLLLRGSFQGQHNILIGLERVLLPNRTEELNGFFLGCNQSCLSRVPVLLKSLPLL